MHTRVCFVLIPLIQLMLMCSPALGQVVRKSVEIVHAFDSTPDSSKRFPVLVDIPDGFDPETGYGAVLFHGGYQSDPHWTVPGSYTVDGRAEPITVDSRATTDADTIAASLLDAGFAVVRYGSIHLDDQMHAQNPLAAEPITFPQTVELAGLVWDRALDEMGISAGRCVALGHSLGAVRMAQSAGDAGGYVLLAGAYCSPTMESPKKLVRVAMESEEVRGEDIDHSGSVDGYELAAHDAIASGGFRSGERFSNGGRSYPWASDVLIESGAPVLALWGSLDPTSYHGVVLEHLFAQAGEGDRLESRYFVGLGHQLSEERDGLIGPIDPGVVEVVMDWMRLNFPE